MPASPELLALGIFGQHSRLGHRIETLLRRNRAFSPHSSASSIGASAAALVVLTLAASVAPRWIAFAQQSARPSFDAASIKPSTGTRISFGPPVGGRFTATGVTPRMLIELAYSQGATLAVESTRADFKWIDSTHYDVEAKAAEGNITEEQFRLMLQTLLEERFRLMVHRDTRDVPGFALVPAGRELKPPPVETEKCDAIRQTYPAATQSDDVCGLSFSPNRLDVHRISMSRFAGALSAIVGKPVIDATRYTGVFSAHLEFEQESAGGPVVSPAVSPTNPDTTRPTIYTALRDRLELKLESRKAPEQILVIDRVERPAAN